MLFQIKSYLKFLWKSKNAHGIHSPFVFDLVTKCFYDKTNFPEYSFLKNYRNSLLQNTKTIEVTDFGAGSKVFKSNRREIFKIAETAGITPKNAELLFRICKYFEPEKVLEIGTSLGLATAALALGNKKSEITTLEGCSETLNVAQNQFEKFGLTNINSKIGEFLESFAAFDIRHSTFDLIYIDGNHQKEATLQYFDLLLPTITNDSVWIFDDIHWSEDMEKAWEIIKQNPKVTVTIDTYQWGFVFFRKEQKKEDFVIRTSNSKILSAILGLKNGYGLID
ncbi:O-methyltransferase [Flavobacterium noncentrifugens]|uniref:Methyltransferase domain-containing protein n=1 Tax=Flavobacterium noncentrifugens TaxID=1128970 RepID=A0A1G8VN56_9FLAO|nr:class I SAM-dependent methyltransferase [Flavobacterium noncentrifugens]GEP50559.1 O-methyltransferase [Flavobacterium noncentrifugens]SDJ66835.1 Methyltransferase domain-containing protein [Flavobacterium noncentrifugens]